MGGDIDARGGSLATCVQFQHVARTRARELREKQRDASRGTKAEEGNFVHMKGA